MPHPPPPPPHPFRFATIADAAVAALFLLSACGGGGDSASGGGASDGGGGFTGPIAKYVGTWKSDGCLAIGAKISGNAVRAKEIFTIVDDSTTAAEAAEASAHYELVTQFYSDVDAPCAGSPIFTLTKVGAIGGGASVGETSITSPGINRWTVDKEGQAVSAAYTADQLTIVESPITLPRDKKREKSYGGLTLADFRGGTFKALAKIDGSKMTLEKSAAGAPDYPQAFSERARTLIRQ